MAEYPADTFFTQVNYKGALSADANQCYIAKWTSLAKNGHLASGLNWGGAAGLNEYNNVLTDLKVFPNPANTNVNIVVKAESALRIQMIDASGRTVRGFQSAKGQETVEVPVSDLAPGIYFLNFTNGINTFSQKVFIY